MIESDTEISRLQGQDCFIESGVNIYIGAYLLNHVVYIRQHTLKVNVLYTNIGLRQQTNLHGPMYYTIGVTCEFN